MTRSAGRRRRGPAHAIAVCAAAVLVVACGDGGSRTGGGGARTGVYGDPSADGRTPAGISTTSLPTSSSTTAVAGTTSAPSAVRSPCAGPNRPGPSNVESRTDPSGFRLTVIVADRLCFGADEDITLQLDVENVSSTARYFNSNQPDHFVIQPTAGPGPTWRYSDCSRRGETGVPVGDVAVAVEPGERQMVAQVVYPGPSDRSERCRTMHGAFDVHATVHVCPPDTVREGRCDPERVTIAASAPVHIVID